LLFHFVLSPNKRKRWRTHQRYKAFALIIAWLNEKIYAPLETIKNGSFDIWMSHFLFTIFQYCLSIIDYSSHVVGTVAPIKT
jgi:hypothetical protein